jgi:hypothetical protein
MWPDNGEARRAWRGSVPVSGGAPVHLVNGGHGLGAPGREQGCEARSKKEGRRWRGGAHRGRGKQLRRL